MNKCIFQPLDRSRMWHKVQFLSWVQIVLIQSFPSPRLLAILRLEIQSALIFTHSRRENSWIHTFSNTISTLWNVNSHVQVWSWVIVSIYYFCNHRISNTPRADEYVFAGLLTLVCPCIEVHKRASLMRPFLLFKWLVRWEVSGRTATVLMVAAFRICLKQQTAYFYRSSPASSRSAL